MQKQLSDADKRLVQTSMLVGVAPELIGNTAEEIRAISTGKGEHFIVQGVLRSEFSSDSCLCTARLTDGIDCTFLSSDVSSRCV